MSDAKGPKIDLPDELVAELDQAPTPPEGEERAPAKAEAPPEPAEGATSPTS